MKKAKKKTRPLTNAEKQARFRQRREARMQKLEDLAERAELMRYLEEHDDNTNIDDLRERAQLIRYLEDNDDGTDINVLRERAELIRQGE
jgi:hypothetical protein